MSDSQKPSVHAVNQDFVKYDQVEKKHTYHLAEADGDEKFDETFEIKICNMDQYWNGGEAGKQAFAQELGSAMREIGFAVLVGHGIDSSIYDQAEQRVIDFFTQTPLETKMKYRAERFGSVSQGYFPIKETSDIHPDLVEGWVFCRRAFDLPENTNGYEVRNFWPDPGEEPFYRQIVLENEKLILPITQSIFRYLGVPFDHYDKKLTNTNFGLRLNYYPAMTAEDDSSGAGRLLGHEDVDLFTILPAPRVQGLQVWNQSNGTWVRLHAPPGSIILNTGDYMQRITNDVLPSTTHRVGKPEDHSHLNQARVSIPMAVYVWEDELLEVLPGLENPKYPPIKAITFHTRSTSKFYGDDYAVEVKD